MREIRIELILGKLKEKGIVSTIELKEELNVAEMTIRRDLKYMEDKNMLVRIHGGAKSIVKIQQEKLYNDRKIKYEGEKDYISKLAAALVEDNETIFIAPGTTTEKIPEFIKAKNITVVTNSYSIIAEYSELDMDFIITGGKYRKETKAIVPSYFLETISKINVDKCFVGANGVSGNKLTISNYEEGLIQKVILDNAKEKFLLIDSSKFGKEAFYTFEETKNLNAIITDKNLEEGILKGYKKITRIINI